MRGFANPAEPERLYRNLRARAISGGKVHNYMKYIRYFFRSDFGSKVAEARFGLKFQRYLCVVCKRVKQSLIWFGIPKGQPRENPIILPAGQAGMDWYQ
jgi:hypothetical protein